MSEEDPAKPISRLAEFDLLRFIHPSLQWDDETAALFQGVKDALAWYRLLFLSKQYELWQVYFFALIDRLSLKATGDMCERLAIREKLLEKVISMKKETPLLLQGLSLQGLFKMRSVKPSRLYGLLKGHPQETLLYLMAKTDKEEDKRGISLYLSHLQDVRLSITGRDITQLGIKPGPLYGKIMGQALWAKLDGLVQTREEEIEFVKELLKSELRK
jgi:tRNA nucleotidyltransferase (CCA-adding enzyme)